MVIKLAWRALSPGYRAQDLFVGIPTFFPGLGVTWKRELVCLWLLFQLLLRLRQKNGEFKASLHRCLGNVLSMQEDKANRSPALAPGVFGVTIAPPLARPYTQVPMGVTRAPPLQPGSPGSHQSSALAPASPGGHQSRGCSGPGPGPPPGPRGTCGGAEAR